MIQSRDEPRLLEVDLLCELEQRWQAQGAPSLSTSGETLTIEESMTLRARTENAGHVGDEHEWGWGSG